MVDFATLVLNADSRGLKTGEQALDSLASTAAKTEARVTTANDNMGKGMQQVGKQSIFASQQSRMVAMQLSQVAQQASATGDWVRALAIQLPDLALGFGPIGIAAGVAAGALLPLVANMLMAGETGKELEEAMDGLKAATEGYAEAVENALLSSGELIEKFGSQAQAAGQVYEALRKIKELEFAEAMREARDAMASNLEVLQESVDRFQLLSDLPRMATDGFDAFASEVQYLANEFGLTAEQATRITDAMDALASASGPEQVASAAKSLGDELSKAVDEGAKLSPELQTVQKDAYEASLSAAEFARMTGAAIEPANALAVAVSGVADQYARAASFAAALTGKYPSRGAYDGVDRSADGNIQNAGFGGPEVGPTPTPRPMIELDGVTWGGAGKKSRSGGGSGKSEAENYESIVAAANRRIETLKAEYAAIGMTEEAAAQLRNETDLFNDAQQKGIKLTDQQKAGLITLAETMTKLEEETRLAAEQQKFFDDITQELKDGILDAIIEGENLDDVFKDLAKSIAKAALEAALFGTGPLAGGSSGGGGLLSGIGSLFGSLFSFDGGGSTGSGSRSGGLDGKGGFMAMLHPQESVIDHTKGGGGQSVNFTSDVRVSIDKNGNLQAFVEKTAQRQAGSIVQAGLSQYDRTLPGRISETMERRG